MHRWALAAIVTLGLLWVCHATPAAAVGPVDAHVIVVTIDGFAAYLLDDPQSPIPTIRKLAAEGTTAEGMRPVNPSVTWPNHTTLITGVRPDRHGVLFNGVLTRGEPGRPVRVEPAKTQAELVTGPTIYELLKPLGYRTAAINWPCTRGSENIDDNFPDVPDQVGVMSPILRQELVKAGALPDETQKSFMAMSSPQKDAVWSAAACQAIRARKPHFMTYHILNTDGIHHKYGPKTPAGYTALALADQNIRDLLAALDEAGIRQKTTIFIVADHGFATARKLVLPNVIFRDAGLLTVAPTTAVVRAHAQIFSEGGSAMVYLNNPETAAADRAKVIELLKGQEGIASIVEPKDFAAMGVPTAQTSKQAPDLILLADNGYAFSNVATGAETVVKTDTIKWTIGNHGYINTNPEMNAVFVASGRGIKKGGRLGVIENIDIAPTAAHLLGQEMKDVQGKVLKEALAE
ncbi:alkaline phosphatase family protein [Humisphaera borealis]|uniref:Alkaline phosphatase family protein n=1 Tax=Humisphaera borealis TaxID=2807512 RepID=A0A7M2X247_9BACT|nr:alkaline phosphatase family protein [Humisphaera borealis]QOV91827.1 alkaline phosphatase family protein [Humisphaera borealis]